MCQFHECGTEKKASGYCTVCGKEVCPDCADVMNSKRHRSCSPNVYVSDPLVIPHPREPPPSVPSPVIDDSDFGPSISRL